MTNSGGDSSETPSSDSSSAPSEPSSGGYEAPPIEQSQQQQPWETPQGYAPPNAPTTPGWEAPSGYAPPGYTPPGYTPPGYEAPPSYPPPGYTPPPSYPPPYPDPSSAYSSQSYPPPPPQYGGTPGYPPPVYPAPGYSGSYASGYTQPSETNQLAIWSLVASLIGVCCGIGSIVGIVLGVIALNQIKETRQGGHGLAVAGIAVGVASLLISIIWYSFAFSA